MADEEFREWEPQDTGIVSSNLSPPKKPCRRGRSKIYSIEKSFENCKTAMECVQNERCWSIKTRTDTSEGHKIYFRCNAVTKRGEQCPASIYLCTRNGLDSTTLFRSDGDHDHEDKTRARGIPMDVRKSIEELYELGVTKPKAILAALGKKDLEEPSHVQLTNFLQAYKEKAQGSAAMTVGQFQLWCSERIPVPSPEDPDKPFVLAYETEIIAPMNSKEGQTAAIKVLMSTRRLLDLARRQRQLEFDTYHIHADATYKCVAEGLPVMAAGTTDRDRHYHPFGLGVTSGESEDDYKFVFQSIAECIARLYNVEYKPVTLIADAADAITNGFKSVYGDQFIRITCWAHVMRAIDKKLAKITNQEIRQRIRDDIHILQLCESTAIFMVVAGLFVIKWERLNAEVDVFLDYFQKEWIRGHPNWFEGASSLTPSTNNALESTNLRLKADGTHRSRLPLARFLTMAESLLEDWSKQRDPLAPNSKAYVWAPSKPLDLWTKACQWASERKNFFIKPGNDGAMEYYIPADQHLPLNPVIVDAYCESYRHQNWASFNEYARQRSRLL